MSWFKRFKKEDKKVYIPPVPIEPSVVQVREPEVQYSTKDYVAYPEAIPHHDGSFTVRFYQVTAPCRVLDEHLIIGENAKNKLINEYMVKYKKV